MNASTASCPKWLTTLMVCSTLLASAVQAATPEVVVAVIDSGVLAEQALLKDRLLPGYDFISGAKNPKGGRSADFSPDAADAHCAGVQPAAMLRTHGTDVEFGGGHQPTATHWQGRAQRRENFARAFVWPLRHEPCRFA